MKDVWRMIGWVRGGVVFDARPLTLVLGKSREESTVRCIFIYRRKDKDDWLRRL